MAEFDPVFVDGNSENHNTVAYFIARFVELDLTSPTPENRDAWRSDFELRLLEKPVGYNGKHWDWYADVCKRAAHITTVPIAQALLLLSQLNGERRVANPDWNLVKTLADRVREILQSLPHGSRKDRLASLLEYHLGIVARYVGEYEKAVDQQIKVALKAEAEADRVGASIARLCVEVEQFNHALSQGLDTRNLLEPLHNAAIMVVTTCTKESDPIQVLWRCYSAPMHVLQAHIWSMHGIPLYLENFWLDLLTVVFLAKDRDGFEVRKPSILAVEAGLAFLRGERVKALRLANEVETHLRHKATPDARMTARFVMAMLAADEHLRVIVEEGVHMYQLRRLAERLLSKQVKQWSMGAYPWNVSAYPTEPRCSQAVA